MTTKYPKRLPVRLIAVAICKRYHAQRERQILKSEGNVRTKERLERIEKELRELKEEVRKSAAPIPYYPVPVPYPVYPRSPYWPNPWLRPNPWLPNYPAITWDETTSNPPPQNTWKTICEGNDGTQWTYTGGNS